MPDSPKSSRNKRALISLGVFFLAVILFGPILFPLPPKSQPPAGTQTQQAEDFTVPYKVIGREEFPAPPGFPRWRFVIRAPEAKTETQRAHTAIKAAMEMAAQSGAYELSIWMKDQESDPSEKMQARVEYYPHEIGAWDAKEGKNTKKKKWEVEVDDPADDYHFMKKINVDAASFN